MYWASDLEGSSTLTPSRSASTRSSRSALLGLIVVVVVTVLLCLPFVRAVYWLGDEGILLRGAAVLAAGGRIYTDFFAFYPPAGYLIVEGWLKVFGQSFIGVRVFAIVMIASIAGFSYLACILVSDNVVLSAFLALAWVGNAKTTWIVGISHHWLTTMFSMAACYLTLRTVCGMQSNSRTALPCVAGLMAGTAAMITSSCGLWLILATVGSFIGLQSRRALVACLLGCVAMPVFCLGYIILNGEFVPAYDGIARFALTQYAGIQKVPFGSGEPWYYPNQYLFLLSGIGALAMLATNTRGTIADPRFRTCALYGLAGLLGAYPRPDVVHISFTAPLALPLVAYGSARLTAGLGASGRRALFMLAVAWCLPPAIGFVHQGLRAMRAPTIMTSKGPVALLGDEQYGGAQVFRFLAALPPQEQVFFYPYMPLMPYLAGRQQTSRFDVFAPDYTASAQYFEACDAVSRRAQWVILDRSRMGANSWLLAFPTMTEPNPPETQAFERTLEQNFALVRYVGNFEIRQRIATTSDADCGTIISDGDRDFPALLR
jgi:hypothetical protein